VRCGLCVERRCSTPGAPGARRLAVKRPAPRVDGACFGVCTFNGITLAAHAVLVAGATQVLILDLDAHGGGGTDSIVHEWPGVVQLDIAVSGLDRYVPNTARGSTLELVREADRYVPTLQHRLTGLSGIGIRRRDL